MTLDPSELGGRRDNNGEGIPPFQDQILQAFAAINIEEQQRGPHPAIARFMDTSSLGWVSDIDREVEEGRLRTELVAIVQARYDVSHFFEPILKALGSALEEKLPGSPEYTELKKAIDDNF